MAVHHNGANMTIKEIKDRDAFTTRCLMSVATVRADGDRKTTRVVLAALAKGRRKLKRDQ